MRALFGTLFLPQLRFYVIFLRCSALRHAMLQYASWHMLFCAPAKGSRTFVIRHPVSDKSVQLRIYLVTYLNASCVIKGSHEICKRLGSCEGCFLFMVLFVLLGVSPLMGA